MTHHNLLSLVKEMDGLVDRTSEVWPTLRSCLTDHLDETSHQLKFDRSRCLISWQGGHITFISRASRRFEILRALWHRPHKRMLEYRLAEKFFLDDETSSRTIKAALRRIAKDLRRAGCPYALRFNVKGAWLERE